MPSLRTWRANTCRRRRRQYCESVFPQADGVPFRKVAAGYNRMQPLNTNLCPHLSLLDGADGPAQAAMGGHQTSARRMLSGRCVPISKVLLFKTHSRAMLEKRQGSGNVPVAVQKGEIQGENPSKGRVAFSLPILSLGALAIRTRDFA